MTVKEAAAALGVSEQFIRIGLQRGVFPWGYAVKITKHYVYYINQKRFEEIEGVKNERLYSKNDSDLRDHYLCAVIPTA